MATNDIQYQDRQAVFVYVRTGKFVKAPFDVVQLGGQWGIEPNYVSPVMARDDNSITVDLTYGDDDWYQTAEQGYHSLNFRVTELHKLGDAGEGWDSVHLFGPV